jgi:hypothetical protein
MSDVKIPEAADTNYAKSPADIREQAEMIAKTYGFDEAVLAGAICSALVMERERCAKIAEEAGRAIAEHAIGHHIAQAIRSPHE